MWCRPEIVVEHRSTRRPARTKSGPLSPSLILAGLAAAAPSFETIDRYVDDARAEQGSPAITLVLVRHGEIVHRGAFGEGATAKTPFVLGSLSKSLTAVRLMQLVEAGAVELDAPVTRYLPSFRVADAEAGGHITVRHLLNQSSGLTRRAPMAKGDGLSLEDHVDALATAHLAYPPGERHSYSSPNYLAVGRIIEVVAGAPFSSQIAEHVFAPLGMRNSQVDLESARADGLVTGHQLWFGQPMAHAHPAEPDRLPTAGLIASAEDLGRYLIMHLGGGGAVLTSTSVATLHHPAAEAKRYHYAMGWRVGPTAEIDSLWHGGALGSYRTALVMVPSTGWGVVVLSNVASPIYDHTRAIASGVVAMLHDREPPPAERALVSVHRTIGAGLLFLALLELFALFSARRWAAAAPRSLLMVVLGKIAWPLALLFGIRYSMQLSYANLYAAAPDMVVGLITAMALSVLAGLARIRAVQARSK